MAPTRGALYGLYILAAWSLSTVILPGVFTFRSYLRRDGSGSHREALNGSAVLQKRRIVPLPELAASGRPVTCQDGLIPIHDTLLDPDLAFRDRRIPRIVHMTSKSRCLHPDLAENVATWRFPDHAFVFHDDDAMDRLLQRDWPEFPQLRRALTCLLYGGAAKADIWRVLVLWEYGGIYADLDAAPNLDKFNGTTITAEDDAFFVIERLGTPSQWFMAASPRHPMLYFTMQRILTNLLLLPDVGDLPIVWTTGPGAVDSGFRAFLGPLSELKEGENPRAGLHAGPDGRTVRLVGAQDNEDEYVTRNIYKSRARLRRPDKNEDRVKHEAYETMGMAHITTFDARAARHRRNESCLWRLWRKELAEAVTGPWRPEG